MFRLLGTAAGPESVGPFLSPGRKIWRTDGGCRQGISPPSFMSLRPSTHARVAELADALDLGSSGQPWGFDSPLSHHFFLPIQSDLPPGFPAGCPVLSKDSVFSK